MCSAWLWLNRRFILNFPRWFIINSLEANESLFVTKTHSGASTVKQINGEVFLQARLHHRKIKSIVCFLCNFLVARLSFVWANEMSNEMNKLFTKTICSDWHLKTIKEMDTTWLPEFSFLTEFKETHSPLWKFYFYFNA